MRTAPITITFLLFFYTWANAQMINTIAGNGAPQCYGDGWQAIQAAFKDPRKVAIDHKGNVYICDYSCYTIRKISNTGIISTIAGTGTYGYSGDGGPAILAKLAIPEGIAVDDSGNVYIADEANSRIRKVDTFGIIYTIAGTNLQNYNGDAIPAISANLSGPVGLTIDAAGNIYFMDSGHHRVRKINTLGIISTIAGTGIVGNSGDGGPATAAALGAINGIHVDAAGNIYLPDSNRLRMINTAGIINTIAGTGAVGYSGDGGPATAALLSGPRDVGSDAAGNIYIADCGNSCIRKINPAGIISTVTGTGIPGFSGDGGPAILAQLQYPHDVEVDGIGNLYITDEGNRRVRKVCYNDSVPQLSISAAPGNQLCPGDSVTFTATPSAYIPLLSYQWMRNGSPVGSNSSSYTDSNPQNGEQVYCILGNTGACSVVLYDSSNIITLTVGTVTPTITIAADLGDTICQEHVSTYTAAITNGGPAPVYQWYENNLPVGTNTNSYLPLQVNGNVIKCALGSSANCATPQTVMSSAHTMLITPVMTPQVTVSANPGTTIVQNQNVTFTATATNATNPQYQWKKNGSSIAGATQATYTSNTLQNGDIIKCRVRGLSVCDTAYSNPLTIAVFPVGVKQISVNSEQITVWPNPVKQSFALRMESDGAGSGNVRRAGVYTVSLCDVVGKELIRSEWDGVGEKHIDMKGLASGVYLLRVLGGDGRAVVRKVVKE